MSDYHTIIETGDSDSDWDHFISGLETCHHEQSTCWAEVKRRQGWNAIRMKVLKGSDWLAGAQILHKKLRIGGSVGYVSSGPFYASPNDPSLDVLLHSMNDLARERNLQYMAITPYVANE
jgi:lipid II:glycine glycyltransferase (peptidoglycan interpeptide bridge formation enzyme)